MNWEPEVMQAYKLACEVRMRAYAPYSKFLVGSAIKLVGVDELFLGCNVENASFGATLCAERTAISSAVAKQSATSSKPKIDYVVVVANSDKPTPPCGLCLQMLSEFVHKETKVYLGNSTTLLKSYTFLELMPYPFDTF
jgi:cytidine deaminase